MDIREGEALVTSIVATLLPRWHVTFNNRYALLGNCVYSRSEIEISRMAILCNTEAGIRELVLHEVAHALTLSRPPHSKAWQRTAVELGATGNIHPAIHLPPRNHTVACRRCGIGWCRYRVTRRLPKCPTCGRRMLLKKRAA